MDHAEHRTRTALARSPYPAPLLRISNRHNQQLRGAVTSTKQTAVYTSSRHKIESEQFHFPRNLPPAPPISNRQFLVRLENAATHTKQTSEANSNRHFSDGVEPDVTLSLAHFPPAKGEERSFHTLPSFGMTTKKQMAGGQSANRFCSASPHLHFPTAPSRSVLPADSAPHPLQRGRAILCQLRTRTHSFRAFLIASAFIRKSLISYKTNARGRF
jgi:hypothetical protein